MNPTTLPDCVRASLDAYFADLGDTEPANLHDMLLRAVEKPLLEVVMARARYWRSARARCRSCSRTGRSSAVSSTSA